MSTTPTTSSHWSSVHESEKVGRVGLGWGFLRVVRRRDDVVRRGDRFYINAHGEQVEKSLSNTCLSCHQNKDKFCDRCHNYMGVEPYCWDCHIIPKEVAGGN